MQAVMLPEAEEHHDTDAIDVFGFWLYIMSDCILFGTLFATFLVLNHGMLVGPLLKNFIDLPYVLIETFLLLLSNFTFCLAMLDCHKLKIHRTQFWLGLTFCLGVSFVAMELFEFHHLAQLGFRWDITGQASSFFTLVGTHGLHVSVGLCWILLMMIQLPILKINSRTIKRMTYLGLFWNFLDIVWIFVFTIVYLMGALM